MADFPRRVEFLSPASLPFHFAAILAAVPVAALVPFHKAVLVPPWREVLVAAVLVPPWREARGLARFLSLLWRRPRARFLFLLWRRPRGVIASAATIACDFALPRRL